MRICFVSMTIYPVLHGGTGIEQVGGAEMQQLQIARLLRRMGHEVSFVTEDHGQPDGEVIEGCTVYKTYRPTAGLPGLRFLHPRLTGIWRALRRAGADVYYSRAAGFVPGLLALLRRFQPLRYIYAGANDADFLPGKECARLARDRWLFRYGLQRADAIVVQNGIQRDLLKTHYGCEGILIPNFLDLGPRPLPEADRSEILWVGRLMSLKRPLMFVELARRLPELQFTMIGPLVPSEAGLHEQVRAAAAGIGNLRLLGFQPPAEVEKHFDRCRTLVSTSSTEGFPNVFLQAMRRGIPIVSFVDPGGMISSGRLGIVVTHETDLDAAVHASVVPAAFPPRPIQEYFSAHFGPEAVAEQYRALFEGLESR
ncbi:MAG: glycosyltransferase family 4 protein [Gammaproteobacteria bacterium]|nr:glycosyltransferase family 4 protein [Gammaproteobacteria bacterium]